MRRVLLVEDDPGDADLTMLRLGNEADVVWVQSASEAFQILEVDRQFNQIILDLGVAGPKLEDQEKLYKDLNFYSIPIFAVTGDTRSEAKQRVELRGGKFAMKDNIMQGNNLLAALGWLGSDLESQKERTNKHSKIVHGVERELANLGKDIHETNQRQESLIKQVVENSESLIRLKAQFAQTKEKLKEYSIAYSRADGKLKQELLEKIDGLQVTVANLERIVFERMDTYEKALYEMSVNHNNKAAQRIANTTGFWQLVSAVIAALIGAGVSVFIATIATKK